MPEELGSPLRQLLVNASPKERYARPDYRLICQQVAEKCRLEELAAERGRAAAPQLLEELERYPPAKRRMVAANFERFQDWALVELLLEGCRSLWMSAPDLAEVRAVVACDIARNLRAEGYQELLLNDLRAEAWSCAANSCRIRGNLEEAKQAFETAESFLAMGTGELLDRAQLLDLKVSLVRDLGSFDHAHELLREVILCRQALGDKHLVGRALVSKAFILFEQQRSLDAVDALVEAGGLIDADREPLLEMTRSLNLIDNLVLLGRYDQARALLPGARQLARQHGSRLVRLRMRWAEGRLHYAAGQKELGEELLTAVHESYLSVGKAKEAASVALDLAVIYLDRGRVAEVKALVERVQAYAVLASSDAEREAVEALVGLHSRSEDLVFTRALLEKFARQLRSLPAPKAFADADL